MFILIYKKDGKWYPDILTKDGSLRISETPKDAWINAPMAKFGREGVSEFTTVKVEIK